MVSRERGKAGAEGSQSQTHAMELRRLAAQVVVQLPEAEADALEVLRLARELVVDFIHVQEPQRSQTLVALLPA